MAFDLGGFLLLLFFQISLLHSLLSQNEAGVLLPNLIQMICTGLRREKNMKIQGDVVGIVLVPVNRNKIQHTDKEKKDGKKGTFQSLHVFPHADCRAAGMSKTQQTFISDNYLGTLRLLSLKFLPMICRRDIT